ncbi:methyltransferase type 11 [Gottschalkia acidurici 9a]|uniref:Arsenite methyltransferase n=1 Tax=Gottschalkia acidurici (strain ATCC 7906 / DSM 604 / BCRC 14475 / CIP 104303 / KCTC 5404 / NCIMB 10678 / 9a) TaxID=1128398 RepID=K0AXC6_GOTA9|nr:class I SAM-dependent methyltransferase [Gottschalkia acidurici]AFS77402.1 methyltransferase type 11 [Gottschalkia acidurici 9a]
MKDIKNSKINKFESETRTRELDPRGNLEAVGFSDNMTLCDIGSGTGLFLFEASKYENSKIYSVEMSDIMIEIQEERIKERNIKNIDIIKQDVNENRIKLDDQSSDIVIMVTVLHEIDEKDNIISEVNRILKPDGKFLIIEFKKQKTDFGPPLEERLSNDDIKKLCDKHDLKLEENTELGENFYRTVFRKTK